MSARLHVVFAPSIFFFVEEETYIDGIEKRLKVYTTAYNAVIIKYFTPRPIKDVCQERSFRLCLGGGSCPPNPLPNKIQAMFRPPLHPPAMTPLSSF